MPLNNNTFSCCILPHSLPEVLHDAHTFAPRSLWPHRQEASAEAHVDLNATSQIRTHAAAALAAVQCRTQLGGVYAEAFGVAAAALQAAQGGAFGNVRLPHMRQPCQGQRARCFTTDPEPTTST